jgi:asparagine synthase (glutamine-hydrolysing)
MCGITFTTHPDGLKALDAIRHRGPTSTTVKSFDYQSHRISMIFHRLSVTGVNNGEQPFYANDVYVMCNGEIFNHKELKDEFGLHCTTDSDCEVILQLYLHGGRSVDILDYIYGEYAFVIFDMRLGMVIYGRDYMGVRPLFISEDEYFTLSSELKGLPGKGKQVQPGVFSVRSLFDGEIRYYPMKRQGFGDMKVALIESVRYRVKSEVPIGFLLSGGLDSSLVLSIASRFIPSSEKINVFTTGFSLDAPDVVCAKEVIAYLQGIYGDRYIHHVYIPTIEEGIEAVPHVIKSIESYDTTTVRASTPMWMLARYIKEKTNVKVVLSGEGSDEINGSYLYFHYAPGRDEFDKERVRLVEDIHFFDGLRADRTISAFGLELRVPFLDSTVVIDTLSTDVYTSAKATGIEKYHLRNLFKDYLPEKLLWRTKAAFSDAVSVSWKDHLKTHAEMLDTKTHETDHLPPKSAEERWYRSIFERYYPSQGGVIPYLWLPRWVDTHGEPSATVLAIHQERGDGTCAV